MCVGVFVCVTDLFGILMNFSITSQNTVINVKNKIFELQEKQINTNY